jgi:hypothetical protein
MDEVGGHRHHAVHLFVFAVIIVVAVRKKIIF